MHVDLQINAFLLENETQSNGCIVLIKYHCHKRLEILK